MQSRIIAATTYPPRTGWRKRSKPCRVQSTETRPLRHRLPQRRLLRDRDCNIAELQAARVIPLDIERPWVALICVQRSPRDSFDLFVVDYQDAVVDDRYGAADERDVKRFP